MTAPLPQYDIRDGERADPSTMNYEVSPNPLGGEWQFFLIFSIYTDRNIGVRNGFLKSRTEPRTVVGSKAVAGVAKSGKLHGYGFLFRITALRFRATRETRHATQETRDNL